MVIVSFIMWSYGKDESGGEGEDGIVWRIFEF